MWRTATSSYQSPATKRTLKTGSTTLILVASLLVAARPYEDTQRRFRLDPAPGWRLTPAFGDLHGTRFSRSVEGFADPATFEVRTPPSTAASLDDYRRQIESARGDGAKGKQGSRRRVEVGGWPATTARYRLDGGRVARAWYVRAAGRYYTLRAVAHRGAMRRVRADVDAMVRSFAVMARTVSEPEVLAPPADLVGRWVGPSGAHLRLGEGGTFKLGPRRGRYEVSGDRLTLYPQGRAPRRFSFALDRSSETLTLTDGGLAAPAMYRRLRAPTTPSGKWRARASGVTVDLDLQKGGEFRLGELSGRWRAEDGRLTLTSQRGRKIAYLYTLTATRLQLSGGDLQRTLSFVRVGGS